MNGKAFTAAAIAAVVTVFFIKGRFFPASLESEAVRALDCEEASDAGCFKAYVLPTEWEGYTMTNERMGRLLREFVNPSYRNTVGKPTVESTPDREGGTLTYSRQWALSHGEEPLRRTITMAATPDGAKGSSVVRGMVLDAWYAKYHKPNDTNSYQAFIRGIDRDAPQLSSLGILGFVDEESNNAVRPWSEVRSTWATKLEQRGMDVPSP